MSDFCWRIVSTVDFLQFKGILKTTQNTGKSELVVVVVAVGDLENSYPSWEEMVEGELRRIVMFLKMFS